MRAVRALTCALILLARTMSSHAGGDAPRAAAALFRADGTVPNRIVVFKMAVKNGTAEQIFIQQMAAENGTAWTNFIFYLRPRLNHAGRAPSPNDNLN